jgi:hypothetical protein
VAGRGPKMKIWKETQEVVIPQAAVHNDPHTVRQIKTVTGKRKLRVWPPSRLT